MKKSIDKIHSKPWKVEILIDFKELSIKSIKIKHEQINLFAFRFILSYICIIMSLSITAKQKKQKQKQKKIAFRISDHLTESNLFLFFAWYLYFILDFYISAIYKKELNLASFTSLWFDCTIVNESY